MILLTNLLGGLNEPKHIFEGFGKVMATAGTSLGEGDRQAVDRHDRGHTEIISAVSVVTHITYHCDDGDILFLRPARDANDNLAVS